MLAERRQIRIWWMLPNFPIHNLLYPTHLRHSSCCSFCARSLPCLCRAMTEKCGFKQFRLPHRSNWCVLRSSSERQRVKRPDIMRLFCWSRFVMCTGLWEWYRYVKCTSNLSNRIFFSIGTGTGQKKDSEKPRVILKLVFFISCSSCVCWNWRSVRHRYNIVLCVCFSIPSGNRTLSHLLVPCL